MAWILAFKISVNYVSNFQSEFSNAFNQDVAAMTVWLPTTLSPGLTMIL